MLLQAQWKIRTTASPASGRLPLVQRNAHARYRAVYPRRLADAWRSGWLGAPDTAGHTDGVRRDLAGGGRGWLPSPWPVVAADHRRARCARRDRRLRRGG